MPRYFLPAMAVGVCLFAASCGEPPQEPEVPLAATFATAGKAACPTTADVIVTNEQELVTAVADAQPGHVIGLDGLFEITAEVRIWTDDVTLTCVTAGSGLTVAEGANVLDLVQVYAKRVTVDHLVLDASGTMEPTGTPPNHRRGGSAYLAQSGEGRPVVDVLFSNNTVTCGPDLCIYLMGVTGAVIVDNYFESHGSATGVHIEGSGPVRPFSYRTDGTRVERNTVITTEPSPTTGPPCGSIRARDGANLVIAHNQVLGPWLNSISILDLVDSQINSNEAEGPQWYGIYLVGGWDFAKGNAFRSNRATGAGTAGVRVRWACDNLFLGNMLKGNAEDLGALFDWSTGANTLIGNMNVVVDNGGWIDCDGDGVFDPNIITGSGTVLHDVNLGTM